LASAERERLTTDAIHRRWHWRVFDASAEQSKLPAEEAVDENGYRVWLHGKEVYHFVTCNKEMEKKGVKLEEKITLQSLYLIAKTEPEDHIHKIAPRKLLYIVAKTDVLTGTVENHERVFERAKNENGTFVVVGDDHVGNYFEWWEEAVGAQVEWLKENL
jgi:hypothetical protein